MEEISAATIVYTTIKREKKNYRKTEEEEKEKEPKVE
jgi:hypothetical protein